MPIFEYLCKDCGELSEFILPASTSAEDLYCPSCKSLNLQKRISVPAGIITSSRDTSGSTCCGREERCDIPPCSVGGHCPKK